MNPQYLSARVPPSDDASANVTWPVRVPRGDGTKTVAALSRGKHGGQFRTTAVRYGDTIETVAARWHSSAKALETLNGFRPNETLTPGTIVLVPSTPDKPSENEELVAVVPEGSELPPGRKRVFYQVLPGDTTESVAHALGVSAMELVTWNALDPSAKLQSEMTLQAFVPEGLDLSHVRVAPEGATQVLVAGSVPFVDHFEAQNGRKRVVVSAKQGETLAGIGKRFGLSVGMMERINRLSRSHKLAEGEPVIVYAKEGQGGASESGGKPLAQIEAPRPELLPRVE
jgi:membrane-bound lytic murein transglycosylase D